MSSRTAVTSDDRDSSNARLLATLCYVIPIVSLVPLIRRDNRFTHYHARQAICLPLLGTVAQLPIALLPGAIGTAAAIATGLSLLGLMIAGVLNAYAGRAQPLPVVGETADSLLDRVDIFKMKG